MPENWVLQNLEQVKSARMQDIHGIGEGGGGGGRFIGGGDRRLRPLIHQAVKCPRCDSLNTKFCYYNNYNLSQPRHFCKSCRRYWTKGGVLRNVPVGGGCRKTKRSKPKTNASSAEDAAEDNKSTAQSPSSESSSLTTAAAAAAASVAPPSSAGEGSVQQNTKSDSALLYNFADASFSNVNPQPNPNPNLQPSDNHPSSDGQIFSTEIASLISPPEEMMMGLDFPTTSYARDDQPATEKPSAAKVDELKIEDTGNDELAAALDWGSGGDGDGDGGDQALFDLTAGVDPAYWSRSDWTDNDQSLNYLP